MGLVPHKTWIASMLWDSELRWCSKGCDCRDACLETHVWRRMFGDACQCVFTAQAMITFEALHLAPGTQHPIPGTRFPVFSVFFVTSPAYTRLFKKS